MNGASGGENESAPGAAGGVEGESETRLLPADHFPAVAGAERPPDGGQVHTVVDEPHPAVGEEHVHPARVVAPGGGQPLVVAGVPAVPFAGRVRAVEVVVERVAVVPVDPLLAPPAVPGA